MTQGPSMVDRLDGVNEGLGKKAPVRVATTANITLSGLQTIDGIALVEDDRVLVKNQTDTTQNGIYNASSGVWARSLDCNGNRDIVDGSSVRVTAGTAGDGTEWAVVATNPVIIDTSAITFEQITGGGGGGSMVQASYLVLGLSSDLTLERLFTPSTGLTAVDAGANSTYTLSVSNNTRTAEIVFIIDGQGSAITTGVKGDIYIPFACTIIESHVLADQSGSIVIDVWADSYGNYPPTVADTIAASAKPTISTATKARDTTLTGWTTTVAAGTTLRFNVDSVTTITRATLGLTVRKSS